MDGLEPMEGGEVPIARGTVMPMNSKRLTKTYLSRIAEKLELPTKGSAEETRQIIKGKLLEMGREPRNVQIELEFREEEEFILLRDADGVFVEVEPHVQELSKSGPGSESGEGEPETVAKTAVEVETLRTALAEAQSQNEALLTESKCLQDELKREKERVREMWKMNCAQLAGFDEALSSKEAEIETLKERVSQLEAVVDPGVILPIVSSSLATTVGGGVAAPTHESHRRRGRAPPVSEFTGEDPEYILDDWLPSLERASQWNNWTEEERLMQFAGHLRGRALQEWNLLSDDEKATFDTAVKSLRSRIDAGSKAVAAQDFRHLRQGDSESVSDLIRRLERTFRIAYGRDSMSTETRDALLYGQFQEALRYKLMRAPAVSGSTKYQELCVAAKNEEKRLAELRKRQQYSKSSQQAEKPKPSGDAQKHTRSDRTTPAPKPAVTTSNDRPTESRKCHYCKKAGHVIRDCRKKKSDDARRNQHPVAKQVTTKAADQPEESPDPYDLLFSSDTEDEEAVKQIVVTDKGSRAQYARVSVSGVPANGVIDTGADITIIGGELFARVAAAAHLRKKDFRKPDKTPRTYVREPFHLSGCIDLDISFHEKTMKTTVYVKMDAQEQLLLSEGVCRQLGIVMYHPSIEPSKVPDKDSDADALVPTVRVCLVQSLRLPPNQGAVVPVRCEGNVEQFQQPLLVVAEQDLDGLIVDSAVIMPPKDGITQIVVRNDSGFTQKLDEGAILGMVESAEVIDVCPSMETTDSVTVNRLNSSNQGLREERLLTTLKLPTLPPDELQQLKEFLVDHHDVFSLEEGERGETGIVQLEIDTGDAPPRRQPPRRMPFVVRQEVAKQLKQMQKAGVVQPSCSPWSSPVVMVRKRDGSNRFCVDYRGLNAVTKADTFPLPRIDDLLDQLSKARYFSTLDLASGF